MNQEPDTPRAAAATWDANREVREELKALLAELEARLEAKESAWRRAGLIPAGAIDESMAHSRSSH